MRSNKVKKSFMKLYCSKLNGVIDVSLLLFHKSRTPTFLYHNFTKVCIYDTCTLPEMKVNIIVSKRRYAYSIWKFHFAIFFFNIIDLGKKEEKCIMLSLFEIVMGGLFQEGFCYWDFLWQEFQKALCTPKFFARWSEWKHLLIWGGTYWAQCKTVYWALCICYSQLSIPYLSSYFSHPVYPKDIQKHPWLKELFALRHTHAHDTVACGSVGPNWGFWHQSLAHKNSLQLSLITGCIPLKFHAQLTISQFCWVNTVENGYLVEFCYKSGEKFSFGGLFTVETQRLFAHMKKI